MNRLVGAWAALCVAACGARALRASPPEAATASCPPGARLQGAACVCRADLRPLLGACVGPKALAAACGPAGISRPDGACEPLPPCPSGQARDLAEGGCLSAADARAEAAASGALLEPGDAVGCTEEGAELVEARGGGVGCVVRERTPAPACPPGRIAASAPAHGCLPLLRSRDDPRGHVVDVARWARAALGNDGGAGAPALCRAASGELAVELRFPDNDVSRVTVEVRPAPQDGAVTPLVEALRALGGTASAAVVALRVRCPPRLSRAVARPDPNGAPNRGANRGADGDAGTKNPKTPRP